MSLLTNGMLSFAPVKTDDGKVDIDASIRAARRSLEEYVKADDGLTVKIEEAALKLWDEPTYSGLKHATTAALGRMALTALGLIPDDKSCKDAEKRLKTVFANHKDKFLMVKTGKKAGVYHRGRNTEETLTALSEKAS